MDYIVLVQTMPFCLSQMEHCNFGDQEDFPGIQNNCNCVKLIPELFFKVSRLSVQHILYYYNITNLCVDTVYNAYQTTAYFVHVLLYSVDITDMLKNYIRQKLEISFTDFGQTFL